jgi:hypothetical protein
MTADIFQFPVFIFTFFHLSSSLPLRIAFLSLSIHVTRTPTLWFSLFQTAKISHASLMIHPALWGPRQLSRHSDSLWTGRSRDRTCRSQWPSDLRVKTHIQQGGQQLVIWFVDTNRRSAAARLLGLRVRIPLKAWMFVLCVVSRRQNAGQSRQRSKYGWSTEYKRIQKKNPGGGDIFRISPDRPWGPPPSPI